MISVVIPTFNRPQRLFEAITSCAKQPHVLEIIVVHDGPSDEYEKVGREIKSLLEPEFSNLVGFYATETWRGAPAASRNLGIRKAKGQIIGFCDDDDQWQQGLSELVVHYFRSQPKVDGLFVNRSGLGSKTEISLAELMESNFLAQSGAFFRDSVRENGHLYFDQDERVRAFEDYFLWLKMVFEGLRIDHVDANLIHYASSVDSIRAGSFITNLRIVRIFTDKFATYGRFVVFSYLLCRVRYLMKKLTLALRLED